MTDLSIKPARFVEPYPAELRVDLPPGLDLHLTYDHIMWHTPDCFHANRDDGNRVAEAWREGIPRKVMELSFRGKNCTDGVYFCHHCILR